MNNISSSNEFATPEFFKLEPGSRKEEPNNSVSYRFVGELEGKEHIITAYFPKEVDEQSAKSQFQQQLLTIHRNVAPKVFIKTELEKNIQDGKLHFTSGTIALKDIYGTDNTQSYVLRFNRQGEVLDLAGKKIDPDEYIHLVVLVDGQKKHVLAEKQSVKEFLGDAVYDSCKSPHDFQKAILDKEFSVRSKEKIYTTRESLIAPKKAKSALARIISKIVNFFNRFFISKFTVSEVKATNEPIPFKLESKLDRSLTIKVNGEQVHTSQELAARLKDHATSEQIKVIEELISSKSVNIDQLIPEGCIGKHRNEKMEISVNNNKVEMELYSQLYVIDQDKEKVFDENILAGNAPHNSAENSYDLISIVEISKEGEKNIDVRFSSPALEPKVPYQYDKEFQLRELDKRKDHMKPDGKYAISEQILKDLTRIQELFVDKEQQKIANLPAIWNFIDQLEAKGLTKEQIGVVLYCSDQAFASDVFYDLIGANMTVGNLLNRLEIDTKNQVARYTIPFAMSGVVGGQPSDEPKSYIKAQLDIPLIQEGDKIPYTCTLIRYNSAEEVTKREPL